MFDYPVYVRVPTENEKPYFKNPSSAEVVINSVIAAQRQNWLRLHGFVVMPEALEMVTTPIRQGVAGLIAQIQAETIPPLSVLLPEALSVWAQHYTQIPLKTQRALDARLNIMLLEPVANAITSSAADYPYSSANARYTSSVTLYTGFSRSGAPHDGLSEALNTGRPDEPSHPNPLDNTPP